MHCTHTLFGLGFFKSIKGDKCSAAFDQKLFFFFDWKSVLDT